MKRIPSNHPIYDSYWLWPHGNIYLSNCYAQFRHDFELASVPVLAPIFLTADQSYRLYVNGKYVCRGPARGYQEHWPLDEIDIAGFLQCGHNVLAVEAYNPGIGTFQYIHQSAAGFICAAQWGDLKIHTNKKTWQMRRAPGNNPNVAILSIQMGFQEDFDASQDDGSWITAPERPTWKMEPYLRRFGESPFGCPPWNSLEERGIPMLREDLSVPQRIASHGIGTMRPGWRDCFNIAWHWRGEDDSVSHWLDGQTLTASVSPDGIHFEVETPGEGHFHAVCVDFGEIRAGCLSLELDGCTGMEVVDCMYHQYLENGLPKTQLQVGDYSLLALATRLRTCAGHCQRLFFPILGARYVVLVFRNVTQTLHVTTARRTAEYPFILRGVFETSDQELNDIHALCRHTQAICAMDAYVDTPWREQGQWWGDARIQARNTFYLNGDTRLLRRGIDSIAGQECAHGLTSGVAPCRGGGCIIPDFSLTWILTIFDYYWQTGEWDVFQQHHQRIKQIFSYFQSSECTSENGLLRTDSRYWLFEDWAELPKGGCPAFLNLLHLYVLQHYQKLLEASGLATEAEANGKICSERRALLEEAFLDQEQGLMIAARGVDGTVIGAPSVHDQVLAILTGLCPECHAAMAEKRILPFLWGEKLEGAVPSSFWCSYLFEVSQLLDYRRETIDFIRREWGQMIPFGGTWELLTFNEAEGQSCCHAWSSHPVFHLINLLCGIRQTAPRWRHMECFPAFELLPVRGRILLPLPDGDFEMEWEGGVFHVSTPSGTETLFQTEDGKRTMLKPGSRAEFNSAVG